MILSFALRARGLSCNSSSAEIIGFLVISLKLPSFDSSLKMFFTILSSKLWKDIAQILPPSLRTNSPPFSPFSILWSSSFIKILIPWKVFVAGSIFLPKNFGTASAIILANSPDVFMGSIFLLSTIALAILLEYCSSPY